MASHDFVLLSSSLLTSDRGGARGVHLLDDNDASYADIYAARSNRPGHTEHAQPQRLQEPAREPPGSLGKHKVIVEDLPSDITNDELVKALRLSQTQNNKRSSGRAPPVVPHSLEFFEDRWHGRNRRNAFVYLESQDDVDVLLRRLKTFGVFVRGRRCPLQGAASKRVLFIGNMPWAITDSDALLDYLQRAVARVTGDDEQAATLERCTLDVPVDTDSGGERSRGFCFAIFRNHADAIDAFRALTRREVVLGSRPVKVRWASRSQQRAQSVRRNKAALNEAKARTMLLDENIRLRIELEELKLRLAIAMGETEATEDGDAELGEVDHLVRLADDEHAVDDDDDDDNARWRAQ